MSDNGDRRISDHPLLNTERVYRADQPPYDASTDTEPGVLVVGNGMTVTVVGAFHTWNNVPGLDMLYVYCPTTGIHTHVTPRDLGWTEPLAPHVNYPHEPGRLYDCPACEATCHCDPDPGTTACVFDGPHNYGKTAD